MNQNIIDNKARQIANIIQSVNTDYRGNLLQETARHLRNNAQGFTGKAVEVAATVYGINPEQPKDYQR